MVALKKEAPFSKAARLLTRTKSEGLGFHDQMIAVASILREGGFHPEKAIDMMHQAATEVTRRKPRLGEIERVVGWVYQNANVGGYSKMRSSGRNVKRDQAIINEWSSRGDIRSLISKSDKVPEHPEEILSQLFQQDALLHISPDIFHDQIKTCSEWIDSGLNGMQYLCPCIFKATEKGRLKENVDRRRYIVFETDERPGDWDGQAGLIEDIVKANDATDASFELFTTGTSAGTDSLAFGGIITDMEITSTVGELVIVTCSFVSSGTITSNLQ